MEQLPSTPAQVSGGASTWPGSAPVEAAPRRAVWWRWVAWLGLSGLIWAGYFSWRPPQPMLEMRHIEHLSRDMPEVAITFDDAPHPVITPLLLASLRRAGVKATFFVIGQGLKRYPELARRLLLEGHELGNHSQNHHNLSTVERSAFAEEVLHPFGGIADVRRLSGAENLTPQTRLFRPPGGGMDRDVMEFLWRNKLTLAWWSNNVGDWARPPAWKIFNGVEAHMRPGDIILLHDGLGAYGTAQAIPIIVREAHDQGLQCVLMPQQ